MAGGDSTVTSRKDGVMTSVAVKAPCACATTGAISLAGFQTVDSVVLAATVPLTRVLVKDQADARQNGIYDVVSGAWPRSVDFDGAYDAVAGTLVYIVPKGGSANGGTIFQCTSTNPVVFGTSNITFSIYTGPVTPPTPSNLVNDGEADPSTRAISGTDNQGALQGAIDTGIYINRAAVKLPGGMYRSSKALQLGYGDTFRAAVLSGDGQNFAAIPGVGTAILFNALDQMGVNIQGARASRLNNMTLIGPNWGWCEGHALCTISANTLDDTLISNWYDPALVNPTAAHTPIAAITVDAYAGSQPSPHYPNLTFPSYTGIVAQYGKVPGSDIRMENLTFHGWGTVLAVQPNADANGDFMQADTWNVQWAAVIFSAGNSQGRGLIVHGGSYALFHTAFSNNKVGAQIGNMSANVSTTFGAGIQLFDIPAATYSGPFILTNCYAEVMWRLGNWGTAGSPNANALRLSGCDISFDLQTDARGYPAEIISSGTPANIVQENGGYSVFPSVLLFGGLITTHVFENMYMEPLKSLSSTYLQLAINATGGGAMFAPNTNQFYPYPVRFSTRSDTIHNIDTGSGADGAHQVIASPYPCQRSYPMPLWLSKAVGAQDSQGPTIQAPVRWTTAAKNALTSFTRTGTTATITFASRTAADYMQLGPSNGDIIYDDDDASVYFVRSVTGLVVTAELQNNYRVVSAVYSYFNAFHAATGNLWIGNTRTYVPQYATVGVVTNGSPYVTLVGRADGFGGYIGVANGDIQVGDGFWVNTQTDSLFSAGTKVSGVDTGSPATVTMSNAATVAGARTSTTGTTHTNTTLDSLGVDVRTLGWRLGAIISGPDIPAKTWIVAISSSAVTLSQAATSGHAGGTYVVDASATVPLNFFIRTAPANV